MDQAFKRDMNEQIEIPITWRLEIEERIKNGVYMQDKIFLA